MSPLLKLGVRTFSRMCFQSPSCQTPFSWSLSGAVDVALRPVVDEVDGEAGIGAADVEHVRRGAGEADELALVEDRDDDRDVGRVRRADVRIVVQDHVALVDVVAEDADHVLDDLRHRAHEHRRRVGLGEVVALAVEDAGAEVLGLADDRGVGHAVEHARHLLRDRGERAADDAHQDRRREPGARGPPRRARATCSR